MERKHIGYLDILRVGSALAVILIHTLSICMTYAGGEIHSDIRAVYDGIISFAEFAVPMFVMITGTVFFGRNTAIAYADIFKNVRKIVISLFFFGGMFSLMESVFEARTFSATMLPQAIGAVFTANTWDHMWYLYVILGIYLIIPILQSFIIHSRRIDVMCFAGVLLALNCIIPLFERVFNIDIRFSFPIRGMYVFFALAGFLLSTVRLKRGYAALAALSVAISSALIALNSAEIVSVETLYESPVICSLTLGIYYLVRYFFSDFSSSERLIRISADCFGIYLIHPFFLNLMIKVFNFNPLSFYPPITIPAMCVFLFVLCGIITELLRKSRLIRKYLL